MTEDDVRQIVREELALVRETTQTVEIKPDMRKYFDAMVKEAQRHKRRNGGTGLA